MIDLEANRLKEPDKIWLLVAKDVNTGDIHVFREREAFQAFANSVTLWIGHNILGYDYPVLLSLGWLTRLDVSKSVIDTLIISKLVDYSRVVSYADGTVGSSGHSIEDYGKEFNFPKGHFTDFSKYSPEMEEYCKRDVEICHKIYLKYIKVVEGKRWKEAISLENRFQLVCNLLSKNGFYFNKEKAQVLLSKVQTKLDELDKDILNTFTPKLKLVREITPRITKHGTLNRNDFRWVSSGDLSPYNGGPFCLCRWETFNPSSHKQLIDVLSNAGWGPTDRTKTHIEYLRDRNKVVDKEKELHYKKYGWKINENNLLTLSSSAPRAAKTLANRILYESRRRTLTEWLNLVGSDGRIHGEFQGIGAWTHRMAHQKPNTANIPNEHDEQGRPKLLGGDLRGLWGAPKGKLLVGCDAEGIQLRIFAHYIDDPEFTKEVSEGDPHTLNMGVLGSVCRTRQAAKRFIYALLLGAGIGKLGEILEASREDTVLALNRILERYTGFAQLKDNVFPRDIRRGWFEGLDGRKVSIPNVQEKPHLVCSGYLQNGEAITIKQSVLLTIDKLEKEKINYKIVDVVHDEIQWEVPNNMDVALFVAKSNADSIKEAGEYYKLKCPLSGSYWSKKQNDYTIATNWRLTH